jgi:type IV secretion system protein TrbB
VSCCSTCATRTAWLSIPNSRPATACLASAAAAPLVPSALAFPVTAPIGWGGVTFIASAGLRVVILGATSQYMANAVTGKTTLLRALLIEISSHERLVIVEDTPEPAIEGENVVQLQTTLAVDLAMLLRSTLRLTPDRIVLGEVRGPEALELVRVVNTGHDGTLCTLHSNGAVEALRRLHTLVAEAQPSFPPFEGIISAADVVLQLKGRGGRRRLAEVWPVPHGGGETGVGA